MMRGIERSLVLFGVGSCQMIEWYLRGIALKLTI